MTNGPDPLVEDVPSSLKRWFVLHFAVDVAVATPMFVAPQAVLALLGWQEIDPAMTRVVAAALFAIGLQSFIGRNESRETFRAMLNLKLVWSSFAILGIAISLAQGAPPAGWAFLAIFVGFSGVWWRYRLVLRGRGDAELNRRTTWRGM